MPPTPPTCVQKKAVTPYHAAEENKLKQIYFQADISLHITYNGSIIELEKVMF
jgi:hypothetical protein